MPASERRDVRARRRAVAMISAAGRDLRAARVGAGLSQGKVGHVAGLTHAEVSRIEAGLVPGVPVPVLAILLDAVGLELSLRTHPGPDPLRDAGQVRLLERLRGRTHPAVRWRFEVPVADDPSDRRAWDATLSAGGRVLGVEAETRIADLQAVLRRLTGKRRDGRVDAVLLVVADTRTNAAATRAALAILAAELPAAPRDVLGALAAGLVPERDGWLRL